MSGVEVLNTVVQRPEKADSMIVMYVFFCLVLAGFAIAMIYAAYSYVDSVCMDWRDWAAICVLCLMVIGCGIGVYALVRAIPGEAGRTETIVYATIDDTVPWSEVNETYELVRQDGKIYQLRVRENND